jgi:hypothetical protein
MSNVLLATTSNLPEIPGLHTIPVGDVAANLIRITLMALSATLVGKIVFGLLDRRSFMHYLPWERRIAWICVLTFAARNLLVQIEQFNIAVTWEGAPLTFLALVLGLMAVRRVRVPVHIRDPQPIHELIGEQPHDRRRSDPGYSADGAARATAQQPAAH